MSVAISSHQLADVERIADRLLVIRDGEVLHEGATDHLVAAALTLEEQMLRWGAA